MDKTEYKITCTNVAIEKAKEQIIKRNKKTNGIRLGLRGGGCDGLSIVVEFADIVKETDHIFIFDNVSFYIDPKSMVYLNSTEVDYETGLMGHGFKLRIPGQTGSCSCGASIRF